MALCAFDASAQRPSEDVLFGGPTIGGSDGGGIPLIKAQSDAPKAETPPPNRPSEDELFGAGPSQPEAADGGIPPAMSPAEAGMSQRDADAMRGGGQSKFDTLEEKVDPLRIGGLLYLRGAASIYEDTPFENSGFSAPMLIDNYLDARPNDRVRGFVLGRLRYDPTIVSGGSGFGAPGLGSQGAQNPAVSLDQLWLRFDIAQSVFFTVGRQKVRWGVGKLWNPTDFLNQQPRDPLAPFDLRPGINAVKVHVPIEKLGWNFYAFGLLDNAGPANVIGNLGGALRAEIVIWKPEIGLSAVWVNKRTPRYGIDLSTPIGPFDIYGEIAFRSAQDFTKWRFTQDLSQIDWANPLGAVEEYRDSGITIQTTGGVSFSFNYTETNTMTIGAEYFYNRPGYANPEAPALYPWLIYNGQYSPLYMGQHYAGLFVLVPGLPGNLNWITLTLTGLMNLSDPTGIVRLDAFFRVLTFLSIEVFGSFNFGVKGGEFRFGLDIPSVPLPDGSETGAIKIPYNAGSFGLGLRLSI